MCTREIYDLRFLKLLLGFLFFMLVSSAGYSQPPAIASYPFSGNANDLSGNGNHGILGGQIANPILVPDRFGNANSAYEFGGYYNKNWIRVPNSPSLYLNKHMSVSMWFKQCVFAGMDGWGSYVPNGNHILFAKGGDGVSVVPGFWSSTYSDPNNKLHVYHANKNTTGYNYSNYSEDTTMSCFDNCEWIHYVTVIDSNVIRFYFNGQLKKEKIITTADFSVANNQDLLFGRMWGGGMIWYPFTGIMDDINIYNVALTQADINLLYGNYYDPLAGNNTITLDSVNITNPTCLNPTAGIVTVFPNSNNAPYQFSANGGSTYQSSNILTNLSPGNHTIRIKTNCNFKDTIVTIGLPGIYQNQSISICQGENYLGHTTSGIYFDTLVAGNGCDTIRITNLTLKTTPVIGIVAGANPICEGTPTTLTANGAETYLWSGGLGTSNSITVTPNVTTTYALTGTTAGCSGTATITVTTNASPVIGISSSANPICAGDTAILTANGASSYLWGGGLGVGNPLSISPTSTTTYNITGTTAGCSSVASITINVNPMPIVSITPSANPVCTGTSLTLTANGANSYLWGSGLGTTSPLIVTPGAITTYTLTGTSSGCTATTSITINVNPLPSISIAASANPVCAGTYAVLTANGADSYTWSGGLGSTNTLTVNPSVNTTYYLTGTTDGCSDTDSITLVVNPLPNVSIAASANPICAGDTVSLIASGANTYSWNGGLGSNDTVSISPSISNSYTVTGTSLSCSDTSNISIGVNPSPTINIAVSANPICSGTPTTLTVSGASTYIWSSGATGTSLTISPGLTTTISVTGTENNCSTTKSVIINVNPKPTITISPPNTDICQGDSVTLMGSSDFFPTVFLWNNGSSSNSILVVPGNTTNYFLTGTYNQCTDTAFVTITVKLKPILTITPDKNPICKGDHVLLTASSDLPGTTYLWSNNYTMPEIGVTPTIQTYYSLLGTADGCTDSIGITIFIDENQIINLGQDAFICDGEQVDIDVNGAVGQIQWNDGSNGFTLSVSAPGSYWVKVENGGCISYDTIVFNPCSELWTPNVFTPNGDGKNDFFYAVGKELESIEMLIFNRWGQELAAISGVDGKWDGTFKGMDAPGGTYFFLITARGKDKRVITAKGSVTLLR